MFLSRKRSRNLDSATAYCSQPMTQGKYIVMPNWTLLTNLHSLKFCFSLTSEFTEWLFLALYVKYDFWEQSFVIFFQVLEYIPLVTTGLPSTYNLSDKGALCGGGFIECNKISWEWGLLRALKILKYATQSYRTLSHEL